MTSLVPPDPRFATFVEVLSEYFGLEQVVTYDSKLADDLEFDSLMMFECAMLLEEVCGHAPADDFFAEVRSVGDIWEFYIEHLDRTAPGVSPAPPRG